MGEKFLLWITPQNKPFWGTGSCQPLCRALMKHVEHRTDLCFLHGSWDQRHWGACMRKESKNLLVILGPCSQLLTQPAASHSVWVAVCHQVTLVGKVSRPRDFLIAKGTPSTPRKKSHCKELMSHLKYSCIKWWHLLENNELNKI